MPYQDISPKNQPFMNFSRPLTLIGQPDNTDKEQARIILIYGFGEYDFPVGQVSRLRQALTALYQQLTAGNPFGEIYFFNTVKDGQGNNGLHPQSIILQVKGEEEAMAFSLRLRKENNSRETEDIWLTGETTRSRLLAVITELNKNLNDNYQSDTDNK